MENKCFLQKLGINIPNGGVPLGQMRVKIADVNANVVNKVINICGSEVTFEDEESYWSGSSLEENLGKSKEFTSTLDTYQWAVLGANNSIIIKNKKSLIGFNDGASNTKCVIDLNDICFCPNLTYVKLLHAKGNINDFLSNQAIVRKKGDTLSFIFVNNENLENAEKYSGTATFDGNGGYSIA
jgi:hypothetical protein